MDREMYEQARNSSVTRGKRYGVKLETYKKNMRKSFLIGAMAVLLITGSVKVVTNVTNTVDIERAKYSMSKSIAALTSDIGTYDYEHLRDLVNQHTHRTEDNQGYWYDTDGIAREILDMDAKYDFDSRTVNAILYSVYSDMDVNKFKNMSEVIMDLNIMTTDNEETDLAKTCVNCNSLDAYLTKNHITDDKGYPSIDKFKELGLQDLLTIQDYISSLVESEGKKI